jgi:uncharacterized protein (DUF169 family)
MEKLEILLGVLGLDEEPMGIMYTDEAPAEGVSPKPGILPSRERELADEIDWWALFKNFNCALGVIWRARKKKTAAYFSANRFGCPGASFWLGFNKPQTETIIQYVSTGIPDGMPGELYGSSPEAVGNAFASVDPRWAPGKYLVIKPISMFKDGEKPELAAFFARPESLCGLHQLVFFLTEDAEAVASPWAAACGALIAWPLHYLERGKTRAVVGGWDPSARKFLKTDELSFTIPWTLFEQMLDRCGESFLSTSTWEGVQKKIVRSRRAWGEERG